MPRLSHLNIEYERGKVFYHLADGAIAINISGMEAGIAAVYLGVVARHVGEGSTVRNATLDEMLELRWGAWYICEKAQPREETT